MSRSHHRRNLMTVQATDWFITSADEVYRASVYVYILASKSRVLYIGVTRHLAVRIAQHKAGRYGAFTAKYKAYRLVYFERFHWPCARAPWAAGM